MRYTIAACTAAALAVSASANTLVITGDASTSTENSGAMFDGTLDYVYDSGNTGTLSISITNSSSAIGGFLTGFVFNIGSADANADASLAFASNLDFLNTGYEGAMPFGQFDAGAALGANWSGGGSPSFGLAVGDSGLFEFTITASDADLLTTASFFGAGDEFAVRFRGLDNGGSDKILSPAPGTGALALLGLGFAGRRRR